MGKYSDLDNRHSALVVILWVLHVEVENVKRRSLWRRACLVALMFLAGFVVMAIPTSSTSRMQYNLGETVRFEIAERDICWWFCGSCKPVCSVEVLAWHITDACGVWIYSVAHDVPVPASSWLGSWSQVDSSGLQVSAGYYQIAVETSLGTISRCIRITECCRGWCWNPGRCLSSCTCNETPTLTECCCKASLEFVVEEAACCFPFFWRCASSCP